MNSSHILLLGIIFIYLAFRIRNRKVQKRQQQYQQALESIGGWNTPTFVLLTKALNTLKGKDLYTNYLTLEERETDIREALHEFISYLPAWVGGFVIEETLDNGTVSIGFVFNKRGVIWDVADLERFMNDHKDMLDDL